MDEIERGEDFFCRMDRHGALQEYGDGPCTKFVGVLPAQFSAERFEEGVSTYTIDIPQGLADNLMGGHTGFCQRVDDCDFCYRTEGTWFRVSYRALDQGESHVYPSFGTGAPLALAIRQITPVPGFIPPQFPSFTGRSPKPSASWKCSAFEVGQGMSAIIYSDSHAYLFDAGAGTPIKRDAYIKKQLTNYDIQQIVQGRKVTFVLSHGDSDHWRMLGWDPQLAQAIDEFVVPAGMKGIPFFDVTVKSRVRQCAGPHVTIPLGPNAALNIYRTAPGSATSNNDGLVSVFERGRELALFPGDCVYAEFRNDGNPAVRALAHRSYKALVVPHHGDVASANCIPSSGVVNPSAFFSAGNHAYYKHPTQQSLDGHTNAGYSILQNTQPTGISEVALM